MALHFLIHNVVRCGVSCISQLISYMCVLHHATKVMHGQIWCETYKLYVLVLNTIYKEILLSSNALVTISGLQHFSATWCGLGVRAAQILWISGL